MSLLSAVLLGITEGITEFLPISSTGHLILAGRALGLPDTEFVKSFDIAIQLGAIAAAVLVYGKMIIGTKKLWLTVAAAFIPTGIIGLLLHSFVKTYLLGNIAVVAGSLFIGGIILIVFEKFHRDESAQTLKAEDMTVPQAILIGIAQALAIIPGISRSAATVICGMAAGVRRSAIVDFSFLLAIPTMAAATALDLLKTGDLLSSHDLAALGVGFVVSFVTAYVVIRWLLSYIRTHTFAAFGVYRIALAAVVWIFMIR
ncbi:MAG: undecaprenyl-diphosphatase UppP [Candidatus Peribacteraceae bacterium]|nr:undecaprenyl-diphosphatase UppP [Candidatus Peribacteraceae bacterium]MBP9850541.1 undecaprenyl-diphosphatase UppP [Candidatus Peribacteraceae bacterium]